MSLVINFVHDINSFSSLRNAFFDGSKDQGILLLTSKPPVDSQLGFLVFIEGTQVQFLGRELRVHFKPPLTAVSKITSVSE